MDINKYYDKIFIINLEKRKGQEMERYFIKFSIKFKILRIMKDLTHVMLIIYTIEDPNNYKFQRKQG